MINTYKITVATWNTHGGRDQADNYIDLSLAPKNLLKEKPYDIVGLQELRVNFYGSHPNSRYPISVFTTNAFKYGDFFKAQTFYSDPPWDFGIGLLSQYAISNNTQYFLPDPDPAVEKRILSQSEITIHGRKIYVFNTHIRWDDDSVRQQQLQFVKDKLDSLNGQSFVLFGDFNIKANSEYDIFSDYQFVSGHNGTYYDTYNPTNDGIRTLDNIVCSNDFTIKNPGVRSTTLSDHSLLYADLEWTVTVEDPPPPTDPTSEPIEGIFAANAAIRILNQQLQPTAILENVYDVSYEKNFNEIWLGSFSLPLDDKKNEYCKPLNYVEVFDNGEYVGLFRIIPKETTIDQGGNTVVYQCEHVLATLLDSSLFKYHQIDGLPTKESLQYLMDRQQEKHWKLGTVEITRYFTYKWENDNLLSAIFSVPKPFDVAYQWTFDTRSYPWTLHLVLPDDLPTCEIREGKNLRGLTLTEDPMGIYNRIYPLGFGEGDNQLTIESVNGGVPYVEDAASVAEYGVREYIFVDKRFESATTLKANADALLAKWREVIASWNISAAELSAITGEDIDRLRMGRIVRLVIPTLGQTVDLRILKESKSDVTGNPGDVQLQIGNKTEDLSTTQADMERRQQINELYSQGATGMLAYSYNDNCDQDDPAVIKFFLPDEMVKINKLLLTFETTNFRAYSKAAKAGGGVVKSTKSGGGSTTSAGGGQTTSAGGGQTSSAGGDHVHRMFSATGFETNSDPGLSVVLTAGNGRTIAVNSGTAAGLEYYTEGSSGAHTHYVDDHTHTVEDHTHNVPDHTHDMELPDHTHPLEYGIHKHPDLPSKITIKVDGITVPGTSLEAENLDLIPYLSKDSEGKITRGWHNISLYPDDLGRINANVITQFFIQSRGDYTL